LRINRTYLYITVFFAGMTSLAVEISASRLLGNVFGTSNIVWACIIGLILIYLTAGYALGGRWADRSPSPLTFYRILAWAAMAVAIVPVISKPVLRLSADAFDQLQMAVMLGSFAAVMLLFTIPVTLLGTASPFAIKLALRDPRQAGKVAGTISAISTLGSFIGTFLPVLVFIPTIGTYRTFLLFAFLLMAAALGGLWLTGGWRSLLPYLWMPVAVILLAVFAIGGSLKKTTGMLFETESAYNYIQVLEINGTRYLRLNDGQGVHSVYNPDQLNFYGPWEQVLAGPFFNNPPYQRSQVKSMAVVGLAAGTTARQASAAFSTIAIDGFEIDPTIIEVGRRFFDMAEPNLTAIAQDGRWGLEHSTHLYQVISIDAYRPPYIPPHLTTVEFFTLVRQHLTDDGVMVINVGRDADDRRLINALGSTIASVFPSIYVMDVPNTFNSIIFATVQPTLASNLAVNLAYLQSQADTPQLLLETLQVTAANLRETPPRTAVFTDDLAPIEWITNRMILNFVFAGGMENLK
jgi:spermidine synthase